MSVYQHFREEEKPFIDQVLEWKEQVELSHIKKLTDFLDPRQQFILQALIGSNSDVKYEFFGGSSSSERQRALICQQYVETNRDMFQIDLFEIDYPHKFVNIEHRDILGSLMALGLSRDKFGDIIVAKERRQFLADKQLSQFFLTQLTSIGRATISINQLPLSELIDSEEKWLEQNINSSSMRADAIVSAVYRLSRQRAQTAISRGHLKVNWKTIDQAGFILAEGDVISLQRFGRARIISLLGKTRKDRFQIKVGLLK